MYSNTTPLTLTLTLRHSIPSLTQSETTEADDISLDFTCEKTEESEDISPSKLTTKASANSGYYLVADENIVLRNNGYKKVKKIRNTLQGELFKAIKMDKLKSETNFVAIKKTSKYLFNQQIAIEDDINFCVSENIVKEALILKYLTVDNQCIGDYIVKYIDFFESVNNYYLVMEYIESEMNLKQFVSKSCEYIRNGKLNIKEYQKMIKYVLWQLFVTVQWLHISMHCCHLDICSENIMLVDAQFIHTKSGIRINPKISVKLCDYGVSEIFTNTKNNSDMFLCEKQGLSIHNEGYFAPKVFNGDIYDAECADNWNLGMVLYQCITIGQRLYLPLDIYEYKSGYWALYHGKLNEYLGIHNMLKYFNSHSFGLVNGLLNIYERKRLNGLNILAHKWFKIYFSKYKKQISKKFNREKKELIYQKNKLHRNKFPFYSKN